MHTLYLKNIRGWRSHAMMYISDVMLVAVVENLTRPDRTGVCNIPKCRQASFSPIINFCKRKQKRTRYTWIRAPNIMLKYVQRCIGTCVFMDENFNVYQWFHERYAKYINVHRSSFYVDALILCRCKNNSGKLKKCRLRDDGLSWEGKEAEALVEVALQ